MDLGKVDTGGGALTCRKADWAGVVEKVRPDERDERDELRGILF